MSAKSFPISTLKVDDSIYPRSSVDQERVQEFAELLKEGKKFEPIIITKSTTVDPRTGTKLNVVLDGVHRLKAHLLAGIDEIEAVEVDEPASVLYAAMHNSKHGKPLTGKEKQEVARRIVKAFADYDLSDLAGKLSVSRRSVERWTQDLREVAVQAVQEKVQELYTAGKTQQEIAEEMKIPRTTVEAKLDEKRQLSQIVNSGELATEREDVLSGLLIKGEPLEKVAKELRTSVVEAEDLTREFLSTSSFDVQAKVAWADGKRAVEAAVKDLGDSLGKAVGFESDIMKANRMAALLRSVPMLPFDCPEHGREALTFKCGLSLREAMTTWARKTSAAILQGEEENERREFARAEEPRRVQDN